MASVYRTVGRLAGKAMRNQAINTVVNKASRTLYREMALADLKLKRRLLEKKRLHHIELLGKTIYRLTQSNLDPLTDSHTTTVTRVLREIDIEINTVGEELARRTAKPSSDKESSSDKS